ncbi:hypothetical protein AGR8A_Cc70466 [Agrobacterium fabrum str. J-07]|nr:hypothetical protein AGR8A_Cc70466 [Agrobacterium fabrum str. J-07]
MVTNFYLCFYGGSLSAELWQQVRSHLLLAHCCLKPVKPSRWRKACNFAASGSHCSDDLGGFGGIG